jgi:hypothetical protein
VGTKVLLAHDGDDWARKCWSARSMSGHESAEPPNVDINTSDTSTPTHNQISGLITWVRAHQLNNHVSSFLASYSSYLDNGNVYFVLFLRNDGQERNRVAFALVTFGFQNSSSL